MISKIHCLSLGDIVSLVIDYRGKTPKKLGANWSTHGYRALSAKNIKTGKIVQHDTIRFADEELYRRWMKEEIQRWDILITSEAPFGEVFLWDSDEKIVLSQRLFALRCKKEFYPPFIYYYMTTEQFQNELRGRATGTTVTGLRQPELLKCIVKCPSYIEQCAIADTLAAIDGKITVNREVSLRLEKIAQAVFRSWFVNLEPFKDEELVETVLGLIPKEWDIMPLSRFCSLISRGITPKYIESGEQIVLNQKCIREHQVNLGPSRCHVPKVLNEKWLQYGDVLVNSTGQGTLGRVAQWFENGTNVTVDSHISIVRPKERYYIYYVGQFLIGKERELEAMAAGSTGQTELSRERLGSLLLARPKVEQLEEFSKLVEPMMIKIVANNHENEKLAKLRDTLLPKLLSGELSTPNVGSETNERGNDNVRAK